MPNYKNFLEIKLIFNNNKGVFLEFRPDVGNNLGSFLSGDFSNASGRSYFIIRYERFIQ